jgi:hypothetical protein
MKNHDIHRGSEEVKTNYKNKRTPLATSQKLWEPNATVKLFGIALKKPTGSSIPFKMSPERGNKNVRLDFVVFKSPRFLVNAHKSQLGTAVIVMSKATGVTSEEA